MDLNDAIEAARAAVVSLGPGLDREIERLRQGIKIKIKRGGSSPAIEKIFNKGIPTDGKENERIKHTGRTSEQPDVGRRCEDPA